MSRRLSSFIKEDSNVAKSVASTSVQDLIQQGLSPEEIREKALDRKSVV